MSHPTPTSAQDFDFSGGLRQQYSTPHGHRADVVPDHDDWSPQTSNRANLESYQSTSMKKHIPGQQTKNWPYPDPQMKNNPLSDDEADTKPTDFDALFSGKSRPSIVVTGLDGNIRSPLKAQKLLGMTTNNLMYENSGFSRNVHFDITQLPDDLYELPADHPDAPHNGKDEMYDDYYYDEGWNDLDEETSDSTAIHPKKSKSKFVQHTKMNKSARWLEWSEKMRVENLQKKEAFQKKQEEAARNKLPAPIIKARKESVKFVNEQYIPSEEETPLKKMMTDMNKNSAASQTQQGMLNKDNQKDQYTEEQWERLHDYWDHYLFWVARAIGMIAAVLGMVSTIPPVLSTKWITYDMYVDTNVTLEYYFNDTTGELINCTELGITCYESRSMFDHTEIHGFFYNCSPDVSSYSGIDDDACTKIDLTGGYEWQSAVIGLLLFALAFGFLASVLTACGLCSISLAKKVYYYHSAGEIYFVCGVCSTAALAAYPAVVETTPEVPIHQFGIGYYLAWVMPFCYFVAAFCMTLDDMIHSAAKGCCIRCRKGSGYTSKTNHI